MTSEVDNPISVDWNPAPFGSGWSHLSCCAPETKWGVDDPMRGGCEDRIASFGVGGVPEGRAMEGCSRHLWTELFTSGISFSCGRRLFWNQLAFQFGIWISLPRVSSKPFVPEGWILTFAWNPKGDAIYSGSSNGFRRCWNIQ
ncbi:hypothetical protein MLD38_024711 [Melastoma candidum]|uniref:Uncharacterized protein n=1 Tax=Melastoma candidum TaxID=119954 RepID=A0ACB9NY86_9MYRT|nr:hypothetical protein MLD38_024711 [Melastoma candidum]